MKKKLSCITICLMAAVLMFGCSLFTDGKDSSADTEKKEQSQAPDETFSIPMTEDYTFTDPEELDFDQRFVLVGDTNCKLLVNMANMGYAATSMYEILYVKDGTAVGEYQYFIAENEESATELNEFYTSQGQKVTQEGKVLYAYSEGDTIQATIITFASMGTISEETPKAYLEMMKSLNGLVEY